MTDEVKNVNDPITPEERDAWINNLSDTDKAELRRLQLLEAAKAKAQPKQNPTDAEIAVMTDAELRAYTRQFGF
jgi:truncated hemoglobin YjbI